MSLDAGRTSRRVAMAAVPVTLLIALASTSCNLPPPRRPSTVPMAVRQTLITEAEITRMAVHTAWDVVRIRAPWLTYASDSVGQNVNPQIQAQESLNAAGPPLVVVDGMQTFGVGILSDIPASSVHAIHILRSEVAEPIYGLAAASGAIIVETKGGPSS